MTGGDIRRARRESRERLMHLAQQATTAQREALQAEDDYERSPSRATGWSKGAKMCQAEADWLLLRDAISEELPHSTVRSFMGGWRLYPRDDRRGDGT